MTAPRELYDYEIDANDESASAKVIRLTGNGKRVLEVGCAAGSQTRVLKQNGCVVTAVEINADAAERARPFCDRLLLGDIESLDLGGAFAGSTFDVVIFGDVLEHLRDPLEVLVKVKPYLANGGYVVASIPNVTHASVVFELMQGRFEYRNIGLLDATHIRFFAKHGVMRLFEEAGYLVEHLDRVTIAPSATEFSTRAISANDQQALDYILSKNADASTYQFIVKALPETVGARPTGAAGLHAAAKIQQLEEVVEAQRRTISKLRSELDWTSKGGWHRAVRKFRSLFARTTKG